MSLQFSNYSCTLHKHYICNGCKVLLCDHQATQLRNSTVRLCIKCLIEYEAKRLEDKEKYEMQMSEAWREEIRRKEKNDDEDSSCCKIF